MIFLISVISYLIIAIIVIRIIFVLECKEGDKDYSEEWEVKEKAVTLGVIWPIPLVFLLLCLFHDFIFKTPKFIKKRQQEKQDEIDYIKALKELEDDNS